jgi:hypothetical protein
MNDKALIEASVKAGMASLLNTYMAAYENAPREMNAETQDSEYIYTLTVTMRKKNNER